MANVTEVTQWESGIYRLETTDVIVGGESGNDNAPHKQLANRTQFLKYIIDNASVGSDLYKYSILGGL